MLLFHSLHCILGINAVVRYSILQDSGNATKYFHIDSEDGSVYLKQALDRERQDSHHFTVIANDSGIPSLSTTAHVWVSGNIFLL